MSEFFINTKSKKMIWLDIALLTALCLTQYLGISSLNILFTVMIGLYLIITPDLQETTLALIIAFPIFNFLCANAGSDISWYYAYILIFWFKYLKHNHWHISKEKIIILVIFLVIRLTSGDLYSTIRWFLLFSVFVLSYNEPCLNGQLQRIVKYLSITFIISAVFGYLMMINEQLIYLPGQVYVDGVTTFRFEGILGDAVFFSQICALLVGANLALGCYNRRYLLSSIIFSFVITVFCVLSYARTGLFLIGAEIIVVVIWQIWHNSKSKKTLIISVLLFVASIVAVIWFINYLLSGDVGFIIQNYIARFSTGDPLTGRLNVWKHYLDLIFSSWRSLFCAMPHSDFTTPFITESGGILRTTHNIYIESICVFGFAATVFIFTWLTGLLLRSLKRRDGILYMMPIAVLLVSGMTLHGLLEHHYYTLLAIAIAFLTFNKNRQKPSR